MHIVTIASIFTGIVAYAAFTSNIPLFIVGIAAFALIPQLKD